MITATEVTFEIQEKNRTNSVLTFLQTLINLDDLSEPIILYLKKGKTYEVKISKLIKELSKT